MASSSASTDASLLSKLESLLSSTGDHDSDEDDIHSLFSDHLCPLSEFSTIPNPRKSSKSATQQQQQALIRSLAKQYLPFLNRSLSILPKILSGPRPDQSSLFQTYRLCLRCLDSLSSQLSCKPYSIHLQRLRLMRCLESCGLYGDSWNEGLAVLESLREIDSGRRRKGKVSGRLLPDLRGAGEDTEFVVLVVEIVVVLVKCLAMVQTKDGGDYGRIIQLVEEAMPWFRVLDASTYEKLHRVLVTYLQKAALFLVAEKKYFDANLVRSFSMASLVQNMDSLLHGQTFKFAHRMCSLLLSEPADRSSFIFDILTHLSECVAPDAKVEREETEIELVELVSYCANKCRNTTDEFRFMLAAHIETIICRKVHTPIDLILGIYAAGLYLSDAKIKSSGTTVTGSHEDAAALRFLLLNANRLNNLSSLLCPLESFFQIERKEDSPGQVGAETDVSLFMKHNQKEVYLHLYRNTLRFLCQPLAELINTERKYILSASEMDSAVTLLSAVQDALSKFCGVFLFHCSYRCSSINERENNEFEENSKVLLGVSVAAFTLSLITKHDLQNIMNLIKQTITSQWVQQQGLKFLLSSLYNIAVVLYRNKRLKEASKALKLSCQASWTCIMLYCHSSERDHCGIGYLSDDAVVNFINDACTRSAFYLDILHQRGSGKVEKVILTTIRSWSVAQTNFSGLPGPMPLVKQWVKMQCREQKSSLAKRSSLTLCELLQKSGEVSRGALAIISEQELLAYKEMTSSCPDLCNRMKTRITDVLLEIAYLQDNISQKARLLIERGVAMGVSGIASLNECIECLSRAECDKTAGGSFSCDVFERHQLATAYCLRALRIQERDPKSKGILQDISVALKLWLSIFSSDDCSADELSKVLSEVSLTLLSNILDLLALKGCFAFHLQVEVWKIIMKVFRWKNIPLDKCVSCLWECRRMSHALCTSPISNTFTKILSEYFGEHSESMNYWISCLKESQPLIVGFQNSFLFTFSANSQGSLEPEISLQSDSIVCEVKEAVVELVSSVPENSRSNFVAGYLSYDLSERLIFNGRLHEALIFAKESHRLRTKLFQEKFTYSIEQQAEMYNEVGEVIQKYKYSIMDLQLSRSVVAEVWTLESSTVNVEDIYISPWNVLQGYLESTLQVGTIHELIGNGTEAETFFLWGRDISLSQDLTHFTIAFSSALGKLYRKKRLWNLANNELEIAKEILMDRSQDCSMDICSKCHWLLEANINHQVGNLIKSQVDRTTRIICTDKLSEAEKLFRSTLDKLNHFNWDSADVIPVEESAEKSRMNDADNVYRTNTAANQRATRKTLPTREQDVKIEIRKGRKAKNVARTSVQDHCITSGVNKRVTRSKYGSSNQSTASSGDADCTVSIFGADQTDSLPRLNDSGDEISCVCNNMKCWRCRLIHVSKSGLLNDYIDLRWELCRRRISTGLLVGIGKCIETLDEVHAMHRIFLESMSNLVGRGTSHLSNITIDSIGEEFFGEMLAIERAALLYSMSWFLLKSYPRQNERKRCCPLAQIQLPQVLSWLKLAFVLCRDVPVLVQKVARLLAITFIYSASCEPLPSSCNAISENYWASFFHQASIGSHLNHRVSLHAIQKKKVQNKVDVEESTVTESTSIKAEMFNLPSLAPESVKDLEDYVRRFFKSLPPSAIICLNVLGGAESSLLQELFPSSARAWMLLSRLNSEDQPIVLLKPLDPILEDAVDDGSIGAEKLSDTAFLGKHWHCPWGITLIDDVIPTYKEILEENYLSSSVYPLEDTKENRLSWWKRRKTLDLRLNKLLRKLEDVWLGPWKHLVLGGLINSSTLDPVHKRLMRDLKSKCKVDANKALLKVILGNAKSVFEAEYFTPELHSKGGCHICTVAHYEEDGQETTSTSNRADKQLCLASQLVYQAISELEVEDDVHREPTILVLDCELQMLPWENIPTLRRQEVYRMPSVGSILATIDRSRHCQEHVRKVAAAFPFIDPLDAFFLLNPGGDLRSTQMEFENWFRDHKLEGKAGSAPASEQLACALQQHDLFIYFGHGSGAQYIPRHEIQKLKTCAATLLMGCSSGALSLHGPYMPEGTPLSYLVAGSPAIIANLWDVTDKDIDRFGKAMLNAWLEERSNAMGLCTQCNSLAKEFEAMDLRNNCTGKKNKKKLPKNKPAPEPRHCRDCCDDSVARIGSFMGQARDACMLPFLIGAAPVCYGVPTRIVRKKDL